MYLLFIKRRSNMKVALTVLLIGCIVHYTSSAGVYTQRFLDQYNKIHNASNGYFSSYGIPYHSVETLMVEAPDHGHETTSEAYSYWFWLEAMYGKVSGDFSTFNSAWEIMEKYMIPTHADQSTNNNYNPGSPATFAEEKDTPAGYPSPMEPGVPTGNDPIYQEHVNAYGTSDIYGMHWLVDVDNVFGFGDTPGGGCENGPGAVGPSYINTFQRGPEESVWRTIPQPTCDSFKYGGRNGFLDLFVGDNNYAQQWKYTNAPDADARAIQAAYWAAKWADEAGQLSTISSTLEKAGKLGDYLRYSLYDKYFKKIGNCVGKYDCPGGNGKESCHYLLGWYYAWGGALYGNWAWRIGDGTAHFGYQNPLSAYALANEASMAPKGATAVEDWQISLERTLELYEYLQTEEGAFAGGVTNTWNGRYDTPPENLTANTFHGMFYDWEPVYHDPPSNRWYGMQAWSTDRLAQYYYVTGDTRAKAILDKWVPWVIANIKFNGNSFQLPDHLEWSGVPGNDLHVSIATYASDVGTASATARALSYYAAKANAENAKSVAKQILDILWDNYQTDIGISADEPREDYSRFNEPVYVPNGWTGTYPNGDVIDSSATFIKIRSWYKNDPQWPKVEAYLNGGEVPTFVYHRFWTQTDIALAFGAYGLLFDE